ncbi:MAG: histidine kinase [Bacteroidetes bacterium]|nr:histidine kinase [Bacteroidota bacterium]
MNPVTPVKRLFRIALFSSTAIGLVTMGPVYVIALTLGNINLSNGILFMLICTAVVGVTFFVFVFWAINIFLLRLTNNRAILFRKKNIRYLWSYLLCFGLMSSLRLFSNSNIISLEAQKNIIDWKIREFGINPESINFVPYNSGIFQILVITFVVISINTVVLIIQDFVMLVEKKAIMESENARLKINNIEATNQKLKQQLQPHFLFNSLNVLKTLIKKQPDSAEAYLKRLSDFLRASVSYDNVNTVRVEEELKLCSDYIEMQKIRFEGAIHFETSIPDNVKNGIVPIFSVQLFLENAIKHNAFTVESPLHIKILYIVDWITVSNNIQQKNASEPSSRLGLVNLSERYKIISGDEINIQSDGSDFSVSIKILQDENCDH